MPSVQADALMPTPVAETAALSSGLAAADFTPGFDLPSTSTAVDAVRHKAALATAAMTMTFAANVRRFVTISARYEALFAASLLSTFVPVQLVGCATLDFVPMSAFIASTSAMTARPRAATTNGA